MFICRKPAENKDNLAVAGAFLSFIAGFGASPNAVTADWRKAVSGNRTIAMQLM